MRAAPDPFDDGLTGDTAQPRLDLKELVVFGIARSRHWIAGAVILGACWGLYQGAVQPNTYVSTAKLLLRSGAREAFSEELVAGVVENTKHLSGPSLEDELQILNDVAVYENVVDAVGATEVLRSTAPEATENLPLHVSFLRELQQRLRPAPSEVEAVETPEAARRATEILAASTSLQTQRNSLVISVEHTSTSPEKARNLLQAILVAMVERHENQFSTQRLIEQAQDGLRTSLKKKDSANQRFLEHTDGCGFVDIPAQKGLVVEEINDLEAQLYAQRLELDTQKAQRDSIEKEIAAVHAEKRLLLEKKEELADVRLLVEERNRMERELGTQIVAADQRIHTLNLRVRDADIERSALETRYEGLKNRLADKQTELFNMRTCETTHGDFGLAIGEENSKYEGLLKRLSDLESLADIDSNLQVLQAPRLIRTKVGPRRARILGVWAILGGIVGVGLALLRQLLDSRLRYPQSVERVLGVRVLGVVPELDGLKAHGRAARRSSVA